MATILAPLFVLSGPSGSGKSTVLSRIVSGENGRLRLSISATTRALRGQEQDGLEYHFWSVEQFEAEIQRDGFLEWARVFGNYYGTLRKEVDPYRQQGIGVFLDIDVQGAAQVRSLCPDAVTIFLRTSSQAEYERRLRSRGSDSEEAVQRRLAGAKKELERIGEYQHVVINDVLDDAVEQLKAIVVQQFQRSGHA